MARRKAHARLSHVDAAGRIRMVDVGGKPVSAREAVARGHIRVSDEARRQIRAGGLKKGDPLETARLAGIMAAKQTSALIPLCHPLPLSHADVSLTAVRGGYEIEAVARTTAPTGVEMEAMCACSVAALAVYDMVKGLERGVTVTHLGLVEKTGGKEDWRAAAPAATASGDRGERSRGDAG